jgi:thymidylate synthase
MSQSYFAASTVDDLMGQVYRELLENGEQINPTRGAAVEILGVTLELSNPRARLSQSVTRGKPFSALGELCWYLAGSNKAKFMTYYISSYLESSESEISSDPIVNGAYGPRLFSYESNQFRIVERILAEKQDSRQAVIQIFDRSDIAERHIDVPCTCLMQFLARKGKLNLIVYMRSNDAIKGLLHDIFAFTMLHEIMACRLNMELGYYKHMVGSFHLYEKDRETVKKFLEEGEFTTEIAMKGMPSKSINPSIVQLLEAEFELRTVGVIDENKFASLDPYWMNLIRLLQIFRYHKDKKLSEIERIGALLDDNSLYPFCLDRINSLSSSKI